MSSSKKSEIISVLNEVLSAELTGINQYFLHAELCSHWGYKRLYDFVRKQSIDEMKHAETLIERVLYLDGIPNVQRMGKICIGENVREMFELDKTLEEEAIERLSKAIVVCRSADDHGTAGLLEEILRSEEEHFDWLGTQIALMSSLGDAIYLSQQIHLEK